jgi:hopene-associated glycosyltransferase HpnB
VPTAILSVAFLSMALWVYLVFARGGFWRLRAEDTEHPNQFVPADWPSVVAVVPARNEATTIAQTVASLLEQGYGGEFSIVVVDDHSEDGTAETALRAANEHHLRQRLSVQKARELPTGWTGKLWALNEGVARSSESAPTFYWFTDADIVHAPDTLGHLIARAEHDQLDLASLMVFLQANTLPERALIPPFLYFFLKLYPPRWIADSHQRTAAAAGGCILVRGSALKGIGGLSSIRAEVIDDCALARGVKRSGGRIWLGLTRKSISLREYRNFHEIRDMIARTAFTELRYSTLLLVATLAGLFFTYIAPIGLLFTPYFLARLAGLCAWLLMCMTYLSTLRFYRLSPAWVPFLPLAALFYAYATLLSAVRFWLGRGGQWKGRAQAMRSK